MGYSIIINVSSDKDINQIGKLLSNIIEQTTGAKVSLFLHDCRKSIMKEQGEIETTLKKLK